MDEPWAVDQADRLRPYAVTGGRTHPERDFDLDFLIAATPAGRTAEVPSPEAQQILTICRHEPRSVAEIAPRIGHPVLTTKVLLSDLVGGDLATVLPPAGDGADITILRKVLRGLERIAV